MINIVAIILVVDRVSFEVAPIDEDNGQSAAHIRINIKCPRPEEQEIKS